jgi:hypothetical protein
MRRGSGHRGLNNNRSMLLYIYIYIYDKPDSDILLTPENKFKIDDS